MSYTLQESYETGINNSAGAYGENVLGGQTFEPTNAHTVTKVGFKGWETGSPTGEAYFDLYNCDQTTHLPTGARLARASYETSAVGGIDSVPVWVEVDLDTPTALTQDTEYALIIYAPNNNVDNRVMYKSDTPTPTYTRGVLLFTNTGFANLAVYSTYDYQFREYSGEAFTPKVFIL